MQRGTIVLTLFPFTDLQSSKRRPALAVSAQSSDNGDVIVAFISSVLPLAPSLTDLVVLPSDPDFTQAGFRKASVIKLDKLATLHAGIFTGILGTASPRIMAEVDQRLRLALSLP